MLEITDRATLSENNTTYAEGAKIMTNGKKVTIVVVGAVVAVAVAVAVAVWGGGISATPEEQFISDVRGAVIGFEDTSGRVILAIGVSMCDAMGIPGVSESDIVEVGTGAGFTVRESEAIIEAAKNNIC